MSTKPPAKVQEAAPNTLEKIAYASVTDVPTVEPNDRYRLGYHVWRWLQKKEGTLDHVIKESGSRLTIPPADAVKIISEALKKQGIQ